MNFNSYITSYFDFVNAVNGKAFVKKKLLLNSI